ncbi:uncharacterized protein Triagg1_8646 [Trichoderma aggressivum f. europaeum]|uniref:Uncharacterized protein n=1 Tax=Trichoderma aggressivum f. europaeum TaxID=173218 RepID=A0AAE1I9Y0_9HYPO|nr:hypothetical protein Triagg1_8646 [Trichoderma aggressivum f. europaeum]
MSSYDLDIIYDFGQKELKIQFMTKEQAQAYQSLHREARILTGQEYSVWLPVPQGMTHIRASFQYGLVFCFDDAASAREWMQRVVLAQMYNGGRDPKAVYIERSWVELELNKKLGIKQSSLTAQPPSTRLRDRDPSMEPPKVKYQHVPKNGFGVERGELRDYNKKDHVFGVPPAPYSRRHYESD